MNINRDGLELIKKFEGFSPTVYRCPAGVPTVYYGHLFRYEEVYNGTPEDGEKYLRQDLENAERAVSRLVTAALNENQFSALVSFVFNLGEGALKGSTLLRVLNAGGYLKAADQFLRWTYAGGLILKGLVLRRSAERQLFLK